MFTYYKIKDKNKYKDNDKNNIFKKISTKIDSICYHNNKKGERLCFYEKDKDNNIEKYFVHENTFNWEVKVYLYLIDKKIVPLASAGKQKLIYSTNDKTPLFDVLKKDYKNAKYILNNLFNFINKFKKIDFVHGNLHLYNILVDKKNRFTLIDFNYSFFKNTTTNLFNDKFSHLEKTLYTIDFYLVYNELKDFYKKDEKMLLYLQTLLLDLNIDVDLDLNHIHHNYNL